MVMRVVKQASKVHVDGYAWFGRGTEGYFASIDTQVEFVCCC